MSNDKFRLFSSFNRAREWMIWFSVMLYCAMITAQGCPDEPGCHLVGFAETFRPHNCQPFDFLGNACCGYCESSAFATAPEQLKENQIQEVTSTSQCCDMETYVNVSVWLYCGDGRKEFILRSAESCKCSHCQRQIS